jgi:hypothetical protein
MLDYPHAVFLHPLRDPVTWANSVRTWWPNKQLEHRMAKSSQYPQAPLHVNMSAPDMAAFATAHRKQVKHCLAGIRILNTSHNHTMII